MYNSPERLPRASLRIVLTYKETLENLIPGYTSGCTTVVYQVPQGVQRWYIPGRLGRHIYRVYLPRETRRVYIPGYTHPGRLERCIYQVIPREAREVYTRVIPPGGYRGVYPGYTSGCVYTTRVYLSECITVSTRVYLSGCITGYPTRVYLRVYNGVSHPGIPQGV